MSSTEPHNKAGLTRLLKKSKSKRFKTVQIKAVVCTAIAAAVFATGTFCFANGLNSPKMVNRSLAEGLDSGAINPKYIENVTRAYTETDPTESTEKETEKATEKTTEKKTEKATEKETEKKTKKSSKKSKKKTAESETSAQTDPTVIESATVETVTAQVGTSSDNGQNSQVYIESTQPLTDEELEIRNESYQQQWNSGYVLAIDTPDLNYKPQPVTLSDSDLQLAYKIVMREIGGEGFVGASIVAQALRDTMNVEGTNSLKQIVEKYGYSGPTNYTPTQETIDAVNYIFQQNGSAVQHRVMFFYATWITSEWHESQNFVCQYGCTRFFDRWY